MTADHLDLGSGHDLFFEAWAPDRELNPQYADWPDVPRFAALIEHLNAQTGQPCVGSIIFESETAVRTMPNRPMWQVESWDPLTVSPSIRCSCGDHGWIRDGRWTT